MAGHDGDPYGSTDTTTLYNGQGSHGARAGKARSTWAVVLAAVFLLGIGASVLMRPPSATDPAPEGSVGNGVATVQAPPRSITSVGHAV